MKFAIFFDKKFFDLAPGRAKFFVGNQRHFCQNFLIFWQRTVFPALVNQFPVDAPGERRKAHSSARRQPIIDEPRVAIHAPLASFDVTIAAQIAMALPAGYRSGSAKITSAASRLRRAISSATVAIDGFSLAAPGLFR
jgi:hypothetical protein